MISYFMSKKDIKIIAKGFRIKNQAIVPTEIRTDTQTYSNNLSQQSIYCQ